MTSPTPRTLTGALVLFLVVVVGLQLLSGTYKSELGHWPDEPAHATSSLMIRDYLLSGHFANPVEFAETYYQHYPKVAVGIWPPLYYTIGGVWMILFGTSATSLLALSALVTAGLALAMFWFGSREFSIAAALALALFLLLLPQIQFGATMFMLDIPVALGQFLAMIALVQFFRTTSLRYAVLFGVLASMAMLIKGNANALPLMPMFMLAYTRRWSLLKKPGLYVSALIVAIVGLPWQIVTMRGLQSTGLVIPLTFSRFLSILYFYLTAICNEFGVLMFSVAVLGFAVETFRWIRRPAEASLPLAGAASLVLACLFFHSIVPAVPDERYMSTALPGMLLFFAAGIRWLAAWLPLARISVPMRAAALAVLPVAVFAVTTFQLTPRPPLGYRQISDLFFEDPYKMDVVLICSDGNGEGAFVFDVAARDRRPQHIILRASKILGDNDWSGKTYRPLFPDAAHLSEYLLSVPIDSVVIDQSETFWPQDREMLVQAIAMHPDKWALVREQPASGSIRHILVYRKREIATNGSGPIRIHLRSLGRDLIISRKRFASE